MKGCRGVILMKGCRGYPHERMQELSS